MGFKFNPITGSLDLVGGGGGGVVTYANFAALPVSATDGTLVVTLDTDIVYVFDLTTSTWKPISSTSALDLVSYSFAGGF